VDDAAIACEQSHAMNGAAARCIGKDHAGRIRSGPRPVIARHRPEVAGLVLPRPGFRTGAAVSSTQSFGTVVRYAVGRQHLRLAVKRQMPVVLCVNDMRDQPLGRQSPFINRPGAAC